MPLGDTSNIPDLSQLKTYDVVDAQGKAHTVVADDLISQGPMIAFTRGESRELIALFNNYTSVLKRPAGAVN